MTTLAPRKAYHSDLTDAQWQRLKPLLPHPARKRLIFGVLPPLGEGS